MAEPGRGGRPNPISARHSRWRTEPLPAAPNPPSPSPGWFYVTADAGQDWASVPAPPTYSKGEPVWGFAMTSTTSGWLAAAATPCGNGPQDICAVPVLLRTSDRGKTWRMVPSNPKASPAGF